MPCKKPPIVFLLNISLKNLCVNKPANLIKFLQIVVKYLQIFIFIKFF